MAPNRDDGGPSDGSGFVREIHTSRGRERFFPARSGGTDRSF